MTESIENLAKQLKAALAPSGDPALVDKLIAAADEKAREEGRRAGYQDGYSWGLSQGPTYVGEPGFPAGYNAWDL